MSALIPALIDLLMSRMRKGGGGGGMPAGGGSQRDSEADKDNKIWEAQVYKGKRGAEVIPRTPTPNPVFRGGTRQTQ